MGRFENHDSSSYRRHDVGRLLAHVASGDFCSIGNAGAARGTSAVRD